MADRELEKIRRLTEKLDEARLARDEAIRDASGSHSLRQISAVAGVTHETVRTIIGGPRVSAA